MHELGEVRLDPDGWEALRLCDHEGLDQTQAAARVFSDPKVRSSRNSLWPVARMMRSGWYCRTSRTSGAIR